MLATAYYVYLVEKYTELEKVNSKFSGCHVLLLCLVIIMLTNIIDTSFVEYRLRFNEIFSYSRVLISNVSLPRKLTDVVQNRCTCVKIKSNSYNQRVINSSISPLSRRQAHKVYIQFLLDAQPESDVLVTHGTSLFSSVAINKKTHSFFILYMFLYCFLATLYLLLIVDYINLENKLIIYYNILVFIFFISRTLLNGNIENSGFLIIQPLFTLFLLYNNSDYMESLTNVKSIVFFFPITMQGYLCYLLCNTVNNNKNKTSFSLFTYFISIYNLFKTNFIIASFILSFIIIIRAAIYKSLGIAFCLAHIDIYIATYTALYLPFIYIYTFLYRYFFLRYDDALYSEIINTIFYVNYNISIKSLLSSLIIFIVFNGIKLDALTYMSGQEQDRLDVDTIFQNVENLEQNFDPEPNNEGNIPLYNNPEQDSSSEEPSALYENEDMRKEDPNFYNAEMGHGQDFFLVDEQGNYNSYKQINTLKFNKDKAVPVS
ncbi:MAG: hypothetical protein EOP34_05765 [Rickettsiales bacterium]|nr:MAG: hypothetical protein EOP34_05765 [Rickettsiales bacterium]